jgi:phosphoserine phosphatase
MAARAKTRRQDTQSFYEKALSEAERRELPEARQMEGLDEEIAVMRVRLQQALRERPEDTQLISKGLDLLVKAVAAKYRLSPKARKDLSDSLAGVVEGIGAVLYPEGFSPDV